IPPQEDWPSFVYIIPKLRSLPLFVNLGKLFIDDHAEKNPDKIAMYYEDVKITYGELKKSSNSLARCLADLGIEENDRIVLHTPNVPEYLISLFACWKIGAIPTLVNHLLKPNGIAFRINDSQAKLVITHENCYSQLRKVIRRCKLLQHVVVIGEAKKNHWKYYEMIKHEGAMLCNPKFYIEHFARLIYTSGTTGIPKGALTTYRQVLAACLTHAKHILKITEKDVIGGNPFFTLGFGSTNFTIYPWFFGASISIINHFDPNMALEAIEKHKITVLCCTPTAFKKILNVNDIEKGYDVSSLRLCQSSGDWLPPQVIVEWKKRFNRFIVDSLGANEVFYFCSANEGMPRSKWGSTGVPVPGYEIRLVDDNFNDVPPGMPGLMIMRGPTGVIYWKRIDEQKRAVKHGWNLTGLIYTHDEDRYLWYIGRCDQMIVSSTYKISPLEIEDALEKHPVVKECAVIPMQDPDRGQVPQAFIVLKGRVKPSEELITKLRNYMRSNLEAHKCPKRIEFVSDLPKTEEGKVKRSVLSQRFQ
ncbi:MAG: AMP-binding protein, partial [Nitrososphaeria archaeon]|nr:AMP-binding protein [Nitrososphaeria archaeon]